VPIVDRIDSRALKDKNIALALVGGGAKCAYQFGAWRALWQRRIRSFVTMSGTSGGTINAMLLPGLTRRLQAKPGRPPSPQALW
jgi:predicted acylesterase/phospholipase RssA